MKKHSPEPWKLEEPDGTSGWQITSGLITIANCVYKADAERILACVSACEGLADPSAIPELFAILRTTDLEGHDELLEAMAQAKGKS